MKKIRLLIIGAITLLVAVFSASALEKSKPAAEPVDEVKSVAWYVANLPDARAKNKECYSDPSASDLQSTPNCVNSLQALKMSFTGANQPIIKR